MKKMHLSALSKVMGIYDDYNKEICAFLTYRTSEQSCVQKTLLQKNFFKWPPVSGRC
jgi:hypothetical protein